MKQAEKILVHMVAARVQEWFYPPDFMQGGMGKLFVGYEASARLSELASDYPEMIESRRRGKYLERRIRYEALPEWWNKIPASVQEIFSAAGIGPVMMNQI